MNIELLNDENVQKLMSISDESVLYNQMNYKWIKKALIKIVNSTNHFEKQCKPYYKRVDALMDKTLLNDLDEAIAYHIGDKAILSPLFYSQLKELSILGQVEINKYYYAYNIRYIFWEIEKVINKSIQYLPFNNSKSYLSGKDLYHVHHNQAHYISFNNKRFIDKFYSKHACFMEKLKKIKEENNLSSVREMLSTFLYVMLMDSCSWNDRTGEWIVFQNKKNEKINFISLSTHDEARVQQYDEYLYKKIRDYLI